MKIYTKTGDAGETGLFGGKRVSKDDLRIEAYGTTDELNAFIGQLIAQMKDEDVVGLLLQIQNDIFVMGSMLSMPSDQNFEIPTITESQVSVLERAIDKMESSLEPLRNFILPSGHLSISSCHVCRTVARRAERRVVSLEDVEVIDPVIKKYLNRLSDYFFVLSRYVAHSLGVQETIWKPNS
jgi:cob(I)alamin adenosyltransferase